MKKNGRQYTQQTDQVKRGVERIGLDEEDR